VVYNDTVVDITPEVVAKFNQMFKGDAGATPAAMGNEPKLAEPTKPMTGPPRMPSGGSN